MWLKVFLFLDKEQLKKLNNVLMLGVKHSLFFCINQLKWCKCGSMMMIESITIYASIFLFINRFKFHISKVNFTF